MAEARHLARTWVRAEPKFDTRARPSSEWTLTQVGSNWNYDDSKHSKEPVRWLVMEWSGWALRALRVLFGKNGEVTWNPHPVPISQLRRVSACISPPDNHHLSQWYTEAEVRTQSHPWDLSLSKRLCKEVIFISVSRWADKGSMSSKVQPLVLQHALKVKAKTGKRSNSNTTLDGFSPWPHAIFVGNPAKEASLLPFCKGGNWGSAKGRGFAHVLEAGDVRVGFELVWHHRRRSCPTTHWCPFSEPDLQCCVLPTLKPATQN